MGLFTADRQVSFAHEQAALLATFEALDLKKYHSMRELLDELYADFRMKEAFWALPPIQVCKALMSNPLDPGASFRHTFSDLEAGKSPHTTGDRRRGVTAGRILDYIYAHRGCRPKEIREALNLRAGGLSQQLKALIKRKLIKYEGQDRHRRYFGNIVID